MKNLFNSFIYLIFTINVNSQVTTIVPLSSYNYPNGAYVKDLNNELLPYVGTWKVVKDNKEYTFVLQIFYQHQFTQPSGSYHYEDVLKAKYEVKDLALDDVIFTTMTAVNFDDFWISAIGTPDIEGRLNFHFCDIAHCYNSMSFSLFTIQGNPNQLKYGLFNYYDWWHPENCPNYPDRINVPVPIPKTWATFTKQ